MSGQTGGVTSMSIGDGIGPVLEGSAEIASAKTGTPFRNDMVSFLSKLVDAVTDVGLPGPGMAAGMAFGAAIGGAMEMISKDTPFARGIADGARRDGIEVDHTVTGPAAAAPVQVASNTAPTTKAVAPVAPKAAKGPGGMG